MNLNRACIPLVVVVIGLLPPANPTHTIADIAAFVFRRCKKITNLQNEIIHQIFRNNSNSNSLA